MPSFAQDKLPKQIARHYGRLGMIQDIFSVTFTNRSVTAHEPSAVRVSFINKLTETWHWTPQPNGQFSWQIVHQSK